jgi:glucan-binding YG repeat protein
MQTGWLEDGGAKYYLSTSSGKMTVGWREVDGAWYYFNGSGAMVKVTYVTVTYDAGSESNFPLKVESAK